MIIARVQHWYVLNQKPMIVLVSLLKIIVQDVNCVHVLTMRPH